MLNLHRRSLPHWYMPGAAHFVTYRLAGMLPVHVVEELRAKKQKLLNQKPKGAVADHQRQVHKQLFSAYEHYLDSVSTLDWLRDPRIASMLRENFYHHDGDRVYTSLVLYNAKSRPRCAHAFAFGSP